MTPEHLKVVEVVGETIVHLAYVILFSYIAKLSSAYLHYRLVVTGDGVFIKKPLEDPNAETTVGSNPRAQEIGRSVTAINSD